MKLEMQAIELKNAIEPYIEVLDAVDNYSAAEAIGYILGVAVVGGATYGIIAGGVAAITAT